MTVAHVYLTMGSYGHITEPHWVPMGYLGA